MATRYSRDELLSLAVGLGEIATNNEIAIETSTINTKGNVAAAVHLNKDPYYIATLGSCCGHYLHHGECRKDDRGFSACYGSPSELCPDFKTGTCTTIRLLRYEKKLVHVLSSCMVALSDGECFDSACDQGHDNFEARKEKEEDRIARRAQKQKDGDESMQVQLEMVKRSMESDATQKQLVEAKNAAARLKARLTSPTSGHVVRVQMELDVLAILEVYAMSAKGRGLDKVIQEEKMEEKAASLAKT